MPKRAGRTARPHGSSLRAAMLLAGFAGLTLSLLPLQALLVWSGSRPARTLPHWYHRRLCRMLGIRLNVAGAIVRDRPVLVVSNHTSWLDIVVLSALAPVSFVAKREVSTWPGVSTLAHLQRSVFVDRHRKSSVEGTAGEIAQRLAEGGSVVLFAEGTSSDGNRLLPFRTSLLAAAKPSSGGLERSGCTPASAPFVVQTVAIAYTHAHGIPLARHDRARIGWYGDMEMAGHAWHLLRLGPIDVGVAIGSPVELDDFADRKSLARHAEREVRAALVRLLRDGRPAPVEPGSAAARDNLGMDTEPS